MAQPGQHEPEPFHIRLNTTGGQLASHKPDSSPSLTSPAHEAQAHLGFPTSSSRIQWHCGRQMCPSTLSIYWSLVTKRQPPWHPLTLLTVESFRLSNPSLLTQASPVSLFRGRCHLLIFLQSGTVWPPHSSKPEVPSFTQKAWKMLWFTAVLMSGAFLDLWAPAAFVALANSTALGCRTAANPPPPPSGEFMVKLHWRACSAIYLH